MPENEHRVYDAVIVGSGFGGSVMAWRLADAGASVCVLERGKEYPPGSFPRSPRLLGENVWDRDRGLRGLYDFWSFDGIEALVSSGVGGGSLIYANVLLPIPDSWFVVNHPDGTSTPWPVTADDLRDHYAKVSERLGATEYPYPDTTPKTVAFRRAAGALGLQMQDPLKLAVTFSADGGPPRRGVSLGEDNLYNAPRSTCVGCGECDLGCNYGAKNTLDLTYLSDAKRKGACIRSRSEALWIRQIPEGYEVEYLQHREDLDGRALTEDELPKKTVKGRALVLAAGSLATTHLLLRNRHNLPGLSAQLGTRFSGNGDLLGFVSGADAVLDPSDGPVITACVRVPDALDGGDGRGYFLQEGGYPEFFSWIRQSVTPLGTGARLARFGARQLRAHLTHDPHSEVSAELSRVLGQQQTAKSMVLLGIGRDVPDGVMTLRDGYLAIRWSTRTSAEYFARVRTTMREMASALGGRFHDFVLWRLGRVITVHPVGGCPMGHSRDDGVVDSWGRAFGYRNLVIADGSVLPGPAGANPSLTIAALANRFAGELANALGYPPSPPASPPPSPPPSSPGPNS